MQAFQQDSAKDTANKGGANKNSANQTAIGDAPAGASFIAHKFGGSSLADAGCFRQVARLLLERTDPGQAIVVSAMRGVTDGLLELAQAATRRSTDWPERCAALEQRHADAIGELLGAEADPLQAWLHQEFSTLRAMLDALSVLGAPGSRTLEHIQGLGEVFSARILAGYLEALGESVACLDAREVLVVSAGDLGAAVDWTQSAQRLQSWRQANTQPRVVITGFIARDADGLPTTLGRNGSDFSGAIFAALFDAGELHIWTDVDGILSADPRLVPEAVSLPALSYREAFELAYFGAKVIHPQTMTPVLGRELPVIIRNTFNPEFAGTRITAKSPADTPVKALTLCDSLALLNVEGAAMIGVPGTAQRVFDALRRAEVSVVMISQASSEQSICCVVRAGEAARAERALLMAFEPELQRGQLQAISLTPGISVLAAVGDGMAGTPGVAARLFGALAHARVNVRAIAQGASERNISVAISSGDATRALRAAHANFWLSPQTISIGVIGSGKVGAALLAQLREAMPRLRREARLDLRVRALANSRRMCLDELGTDAADWRSVLDTGSSVDCDLERFADHVHTDHLPHAVIIDCSASDNVAARYEGWLARGIHVITPNKQAGAGPLDRYQRIRQASRHSGARFRYEATVGAGLPVIQTLRDLLDTGDQVHAIEGIFSGTLAWLFNRFDGSQPFSALVREALALGYTEPDPRDDLSGVDVARKLVILGREAGLPVSLQQVRVESLVPDSLREASADEFLRRLDEGDAAMAARFAQAAGAGEVLRYVARLDAQGNASVGLARLPRTHAFGNLRLTDNIVQFTTRRYAQNPLVVQGPGAGPEVTAAGVFADLLRVSAALGAPI